MPQLTRVRVRVVLPALTIAIALIAVATASAALPDGRAYEMVSPVQKDGALVAGGLPSVDGNAVDYGSLGALPGDTSATIANYGRFTRTATGWKKTLLTPTPNVDSVPPGTTIGPVFSTDDLSKAIFSTVFAFDPLDQDVDALGGYEYGHNDLYSSDGTSTPTMLSIGPAADAGKGPDEATFDGATPDAGHVVFSTSEPLTANAGPLTPDSTGLYGQYLYDRTGGQTHLVNVDSTGTMLNGGGAVLGDGWYVSGNNLTPAIYSVTTNAISTDGSKVFFESPAPTNFGSHDVISHLWVRSNNATTDEIDDAAATDPAQSAQYEGAAADGSKVFFTTTQALTPDDTNTTNDLYVYDTASKQRTRLTKGATGADDTRLEGVVAVSNDGSHIWFVADAPLATGGAADAHNLYVADTTTNTTTFVAAVSDTDSGPNGILTVRPDQSREAVPTPDGSVLLFGSTANLTGHNTTGQPELYRYTTATKAIVCVSCTAGAASASGPATIGATVGGSYRPAGFSTPMTSDGSEIFFSTPDALVSADVNGKGDVYEWHNGAVSLISDGHSTRNATLGGVNPSGSDVFFNTYGSLVPQDTDGGQGDLYDARVGGGFPAPPSTPADCDGDGCRPGSTPTPFFPSPGSDTLIGPGNVKPTKPAKTLPTQLVTVRPIAAKARRGFARSGKLTLTVHAFTGGRISVSVRGALKKHGRVGTLASANRRVGKAGNYKLKLKLSKAARNALKRRGRLAISIVAGLSRNGETQTAHLTLQAPKTKKGA